MQKDAQSRMAPIIAKIFDQFVPNKSPGVDPEICRALVKEFLTACRALVKEFLTACQRLLAKVLVELINRSDKMADDIFEVMDSQSDKMADDIFEAMDSNKDGIVPRKEFEKEFMQKQKEFMQRIVNMQVNMQVLALDMMIIMRRVQVLAVWFYYCLLLLLLLLLLRSLLGGILLLARFCLALLKQAKDCFERPAAPPQLFEELRRKAEIEQQRARDVMEGHAKLREAFSSR